MPRLGQICKLLRGYGINTGPEALKQHDWWKNPKATDDLIDTAVAKAKERKPLSIISVNYLRPIIDELLNPPPVPEAKPRKDFAWAASNQGIDAMARKLKIKVLPSHSYPDVKQMCFDEIRRLEGSGS